MARRASIEIFVPARVEAIDLNRSEPDWQHGGSVNGAGGSQRHGRSPKGDRAGVSESTATSQLLRIFEQLGHAFK
jgi:hypothetical protein